MNKKILALILVLGIASMGASPAAVISQGQEGTKEFGVDDFEVFEAEAYIQGAASLTTDLVDHTGTSLGIRKIDFGTVGGQVVKAADKYIQINYTTNQVGGAVAIHTDNADAAIPQNPDGTYYKYLHDWGHNQGETWVPPGTSDPVVSPEFGAGLVLGNDGASINQGQIMKSAPVLWGVFDRVDGLSSAHSYQFTGNKYPAEQGGGYMDEAKITDPMEDAYTDGVNYRTLVWWGYGSPQGDLLSMYAGRDANHSRTYDPGEYAFTTDQEVFVTVGGDFRGLPGSDKKYGTLRLIVEVYHL